MKISTRTEYGIRILVTLAGVGAGDPCMSLTQIAKREKLPHAYLEHCDRPQPCSVHEVFQRVYESLSLSLGAVNLAEVAATAGGPPYPPEVRRRRIALHSALS